MAQNAGFLVRREQSNITIANPSGDYFFLNRLARVFGSNPLASWDTTFTAGWKGGVPANGDTLSNLGRGQSGQPITVRGSAITSGGEGFDFSACDSSGAGYLESTGTVVQAIADAANDYFFMGAVVKLPNSTDFNTSTTPLPFVNVGAPTGASAALAMLAMLTGGGQRVIGMYRQISASTVDTAPLVNVQSLNGGLAIIACWRTATEQRVAVISGITASAATTTLSSAVAVGSNNSLNFSGLKAQWGVGTTNWSNNAASLAANNFREYMGFIGCLPQDGSIDPQVALAAILAEVQAVIAEDIAANGSQTIFV